MDAGPLPGLVGILLFVLWGMPSSQDAGRARRFPTTEATPSGSEAFGGRGFQVLLLVDQRAVDNAIYPARVLATINVISAAQIDHFQRRGQPFPTCRSIPS